MRIPVAASLWPLGAVPVAYACDEIAAAGFDAVEIWWPDVERRADGVAELGHALRAAGLAAACVAFQEGVLPAGDPTRVLDDAERRVDACVRLGCGLLLVVPDVPGGPATGGERHLLAALGARARAAGVRVGLEFLGGTAQLAEPEAVDAWVAELGSPYGTVADCHHLARYEAGSGRRYAPPREVLALQVSARVDGRRVPPRRDGAEADLARRVLAESRVAFLSAEFPRPEAGDAKEWLVTSRAALAALAESVGDARPR